MQITYALGAPCPHNAIPGSSDCTERGFFVLWRVQFCCQLVSFAAIKGLCKDTNIYHRKIYQYVRAYKQVSYK